MYITFKDLMHVPWRINEWNATNKRGEILDTLNLKRVQMIMKKDFIQRLRMGKWTYRYLYLKYKNVLFANHIYIISRKAIIYGNLWLKYIRKYPYLNFGLIAGLIDSDRRLFLFIGREFPAPMWPRVPCWRPNNGDFPATAF